MPNIHDAVKVHAVDTNARIILDAQVNVLADAEAKVARLGEIAALQLVLLDLEATLENLLGLGTTHGDVHSDLLVTADTERTDGVAGLACTNPSASLSAPIARFPISRGFHTVHRSLTAKLLQHLRGTSETVTGLADGDIQHELLNAQLAHRVLALVLAFRL